MLKNKKGVVLLYVLFLVILSVIFATILLNSSSSLYNINRHFDFESKLYTNIKTDGNIIVDINREYNSNGSGFIDNISCPGTITLSGTTSSDNVSSEIFYDGYSNYCKSSDSIKPLELYFNTGMTDIIEASYSGYIVSITAGVGDTSFLDPDSTYIDFSSSLPLGLDDIDDDFNSDNYIVTSTGTIGTGTYYPGGFQDDDNMGRKTLYGYVSPDIGFKKVFWNTTKTSEIVNQNPNNSDTLNEKIGDISSGYIYLDIDKDFAIKVYEFDKASYDEYNELVINSSYSGLSSAGIGYLQENSGILSLSASKTGNEMSFDFVLNDYAILLDSTSNDTLLYRLSVETPTGTGVYITPIDDSDDLIVKYIGNDLIISQENDIIAKQLEVIYKK